RPGKGCAGGAYPSPRSRCPWLSPVCTSHVHISPCRHPVSRSATTCHPAPLPRSPWLAVQLALSSGRPRPSAAMIGSCHTIRPRFSPPSLEPTAMRPSSLDPLFAEVTSLPGVGPRMRLLFDRLVGEPGKPARVLDLLFHLPHGAVDRRARPTVADAVPGEVVTLCARALSPPPALPCLARL